MVASPSGGAVWGGALPPSPHQRPGEYGDQSSPTPRSRLPEVQLVCVCFSTMHVYAHVHGV